MEKIFRIAESQKIGNLIREIGDTCKVSEDYFYNLLQIKVKEITKDQPEKYDEVLQDVKDHILSSKKRLINS